MLDIEHRQRSCVRTSRIRDVSPQESSGGTVKMRKLRERVACDYSRGRIRVDAPSRILVIVRGCRATMPVKPLTVILMMTAAAVLFSCQIGGDNAEAAATPTATTVSTPVPPASTPIPTAAATVTPTSTLPQPNANFHSAANAPHGDSDRNPRDNRDAYPHDHEHARARFGGQDRHRPQHRHASATRRCCRPVRAQRAGLRIRRIQGSPVGSGARHHVETRWGGSIHL